MCTRAPHMYVCMYVRVIDTEVCVYVCMGGVHTPGEGGRGTRTGMHPDRWSRAAAWTGSVPSGRMAAAGSGHPRVRCVPGPGRSLPAGAALGQTLQNGLQVLLVGSDLGEVALEALNLLLLLLRLPLQQPQLPLQGPGWAQPQPQALQGPLGLIQGPGWGPMGVQRLCGGQRASARPAPGTPGAHWAHPEALPSPSPPGCSLPTMHQEGKGLRGRCGDSPVWDPTNSCADSGTFPDRYYYFVVGIIVTV